MPQFEHLAVYSNPGINLSIHTPRSTSETALHKSSSNRRHVSVSTKTTLQVIFAASSRSRPSIALLRSTWSRDLFRASPPLFLREAEVGITMFPPELCQDGTGGTYFMKDSRNKTVAVFKPQDEDPLSKLNPKRREIGTPLHFRGIRPGEAALREVLASQLAPEIFRVPETFLAEVNHWIFTDACGSSLMKSKKGSLQKFVSGMVTAEEIGSTLFSQEDVHSIALLDILMVNCDRNGGNILVRPETYDLVPIDHGFSLPDFHNLLDLQWFEWMNYRQSKSPVSERLKTFVKNIDIALWVEKAVALQIRPECILTMRLAFAFLTEALSCNKTLFDIGKLMCSPNPKNPSVFVCLVNQAQLNASSFLELFHHFSILVSDYFSQ